MQFAGGLSQIRPVNAIPAPVGLVFGPVGAVACALGNLLGDLPDRRQGGQGLRMSLMVLYPSIVLGVTIIGR
jgi:hypothetical protein